MAQVHDAVIAIRRLFGDDEIPDKFRYEGQTFYER